MKRGIVLAGLLALAAFTANAQSAPNAINYQGTLSQDDGTPSEDGTYTISFRLYDDPTAGNLIWGRTYTEVTVKNGQFNVILGGGGTPVPAPDPPGSFVQDIGAAFADEGRYIGITVDADPNGPLESPEEFAPRQQILSAPYALTASNPLNRVPPGTILPFGGPVGVDQPLGYLPCNGAAYSKTLYPDLYEALKKDNACVWGETLDTFNVPNLTGRSLAGSKDMGGLPELNSDGTNPYIFPDFYLLSYRLGFAWVQLTLENMPKHKHTISSLPHDHYVAMGNVGGFGNYAYGTNTFDHYAQTMPGLPVSGETDAVGGAAGSVEGDPGLIHASVPPSTAVNFIIRY